MVGGVLAGGGLLLPGLGGAEKRSGEVVDLGAPWALGGVGGACGSGWGRGGCCGVDVVMTECSVCECLELFRWNNNNCYEFRRFICEKEGTG